MADEGKKRREGEKSKIKGEKWWGFKEVLDASSSTTNHNA
jgi:hypothetical protein